MEKKCSICGVDICLTPSIREGRKLLRHAVTKLYNIDLPDCQCILSSVCLQCYVALRGIVAIKRNGSKISWEVLRKERKLPDVLSVTFGCSQCSQFRYNIFLIVTILYCSAFYLSIEIELIIFLFYFGKFLYFCLYINYCLSHAA